MKNIDEECPLEGEKTITKNVDLPKQIPPVRPIVLDAINRSTDFG